MAAVAASEIAQRLREIVGDAHVIAGEGLEPYTHDATFMDAALPCAVFPGTTEEVAAIVKACSDMGTPVLARGGGSSLVGGSVPIGGAVVLSLDRFNTIEIDPANVVAVAGAGVITGHLQDAAAEHGLMYPPDPASISMCTIGGNIACNSGGMVCVKYGVTADYVIGMTVVTAAGTILRLGGRTRKRASGYRLAQLFIGSEGTLGIVTEVVVKLIPKPRFRATAMVGYHSIEAAARAVPRLLGSGHFPTAIEIIDRRSLEMVRKHLPAGFDTGLGAALIVEQDGNDREHVDSSLLEIVELLDGVENRVAQSEAEREKIWKARRSFGHVLMAMRKNFFAEDVAVPISQIPEMVRRVERIAAETGLEIGVIGHAGDGNLHPTILFSDEQRPLVGRAAARIFRDAVELGGSISAEHGLGALKRDYAELEHGPDAMELMRSIKALLDPKGILNPHKVFPESPADDDFLARQPGWGVKREGEIRDRSELGA